MDYRLNDNYFIINGASHSFSNILTQLKELYRAANNRFDNYNRIMFIVDKSSQKDEIYLIIPKHNAISNGLDAIGIIDELNASKFALSYTILNKTSYKSFWCINQRSQPFELSQIEYLWPRFFDKINGRYQTLNPTNATLLNVIMKTDVFQHSHSEIISVSKPEQVIRQDVYGYLPDDIQMSMIRYKEWNLDQILQWISLLDDGQYKPWINQLRVGFIASDIITGDLLPELTRSDLSVPPFSKNG